MDYRIHLNFATAAVVVIIAAFASFLTSTVVAARAYVERGAQVSRGDQTIIVKGSTRKRIRSDRAVWRIIVYGEAPELTEAFSILDSGVSKVQTFLQERGFTQPQIGLGSIDTTTHYIRDKKIAQTRQVESYLLDRTIFVTTEDVDRVQQAAGEVTQLIEAGIRVVSCMPEYHYKYLADLKIELMSAASADARLRAEKIAQAAGCRIAEVRSARMGVLQITQPYSTDVSDYGIHDTSTIDKDVTAVVSVTFQIEAN